MRERAAPCGATDSFCGCRRCAALPAKPDWMETREALVTMAKLVLMAAPEHPLSWRMHADAHVGIGDHVTASKSYVQAGKLSGHADDGAPGPYGERKGPCLVHVRVVPVHPH